MWMVPENLFAEQKQANFDQKAIDILREMSTYLDSLEAFSFHTENTTDEVRTFGQKLQFADAVDVFVKRPDRLRANVKGDFRRQEFFYDGKSITLVEVEKNLFATLQAPPTIEEALNHAFEKFALEAPLADFIYRQSHEILTDGALAGTYLGLHFVHGVQCHHLAFMRDDLDLQIWIEAGPTPLPRKVIITDK